MNIWEAEEIGPSGEQEDHDGVYVLFAGPNAERDALAFQTAAAARGVLVLIGPHTAAINPTTDEAVALLWALEDKA